MTALGLRTASRGTHRRVVGLLLLAGLLALPLGLAQHRTPAGPAPAFLQRAVGEPAAKQGPLPSTAFARMHSRVTRRGVGVSAAWAKLSLASRDAGNAAWHRYAKGAARTTPFGTETITLSGIAAEEYLTVDRHLGLHTWRWSIGSTLEPHLRDDGTIRFTDSRGKTVLLTIGKPIVLDARGRPLAIAGLRWGLEGRVLTLRLDDTTLPTPYTIDPSISLTASAFTTVKGSGQNGNFTLTIPAGAQAGDLLVVQLVQRSTTAPTVPVAIPAWTLFSSQTDATNGLAQYIYTRVMSASDVAGTTAYTWTVPSAIDAAGGLVALRNVDGAPTSPSQQSAQATGTTSPATATVTTDSIIGSNSDYVVAFYGGKGNFTFSETNASLTGLWSSATNQIPNGSGQLTGNNVGSGSSGASRANSLVSAGQFAANTAVTPNATLSAANAWMLNVLAFRVAVPYDQALPTISGTIAVGQTLTAVSGTWSNSPTGYAYQWLRCDSSGANCASISGATSSTYVLTSADSGSTIRVQVTASNALGTGQTVQSAQTAALPAPDGSGTLTTGTTNVTAGSTGNTITFTYTAASGGLSSGKVQLTLPGGWTPPSITGTNAGFTTASTGTVGVAGQVITVSNVTLASGATMTITYGSKASSGPGATATTTAGSPTWSAAEASTSGATPVGLASSPSITVDPAAASKLAWSQQPTSISGGATISPSPTVTVQDQYGNTVTSSSASISVAIGTNPSSGTLSGATSVSAASGVATFSSLSINKAGTGYTLAASSTGLTGATSSTFNVTVGAASKLAFTQQPSNATAGSSLSPAVTVTVQDAGGNTVTTSSASITVAIGTNPGGGTLSGTATANASSGVASFSNLSINKAGTGYTLTAAATGLTGATSSSFSINPGAANKLSFTQQPTSANAGSAISPAITVAVQDSLGNTVTSSSASITTAIGTNPGGGTLSGTTSANASSGVATFSNLSVNKAGTGYTLTASATGLTGATSSSFSINVGAVDATQSTVSASPSTVTADGSTTSTVTVTAKDAFGNPVSAQSVSLSQGTGSSTITTVSGTTDSSGQASFTVKDTVAQTVTYTATIGTTTVLQTTAVAFTPGAATHFTVSAPASATAGGAVSVTVTAYDANNNVATGYAGTVHFTSTDGQAVLPANYTFVPGTDAGAHTFSVTLKTAGSKNVTATDTVAGSINGSASVTVNAAAASATVSTAAASPTSVLADNSTTSTITATLTDAYGNGLAGKTMTLTAGSGSSTITTVSGTTDASGHASWTVKDANVETVAYTAKDTTDNLTITQTASVAFTVGPVTAAQSTVSASPSSVTADGSASSTITVTLKDAQSHPVIGKTVTLAKSGGSSIVTTVSGTTNASGQATFTVKDAVAETTTYTATDSTDSVTVTQTASVAFTPGAVSAAQSTVSASPTSVTADGSTASTVTVTLKDATGNAVSGKNVTLAKGSGSSTITAVSGTTDAAGHATFTVKDTAAETTTYTAADSTDSVTVTQTAAVTFVAGAVSTTQSTISSSPGSVTADGSTTSTITVTAKDTFGNPVPSQSVSLAQGGGSSTITTVSGTTNASGQATFTVKDTTAQSVTYSATIGATTILATASVTFTPGPATHLGVGAPASATAGSAVSVTVTALDAHNNTATAYSGTVHFTSSDGQAVLPADYTFVPGTDAGAHTFSATLKTAGSKSVTATDTITGSITGSTTVAVNAAGASAAVSTVSATPGSVVADGSTTSTVTATITDAYGNPLTGKAVTLAKSGGSSTVTTVSGTTNASGQATFTVKDAVAETTTYTATDTTDSVTVTQTASVTFTPGTPTASGSTVSASPPSVLADGSTASTVTVTLKDANGNVVPGKTVTLAADSGSSTITTVTGTTNAAGQATFTVKDAAVESVTYTATDTTDAVAVTQTATVSFTLGAVSASQSTVSASPTSVTADGSTTSTVTVTLKDAQSHPVPGKSVSLAAGGGSSTIATVSGTTNASGRATFTVKDAVAEAVTYTATDSTDAVTVTQTATVTFTPGAVSASQSTVSASPTSVTADGSATSTITVTLKDANGNALFGKTVTLAKSGGSSTITTVSGTTDASGHAGFTVKDAVAEATTYTATDATDSVAVTQTAAVTFTSGAVSAAQSTVAASPTSVTADGSTTSTIAVTLKDASGNPISGKTVTLAKSGGSSTISTVSGTTDAAGHATFTVKDGAVESTTYTATDSTDSVTVTQTAAVSFAAGAVDATASTVSASPGSVTADGSATSTITVTANDAFGHPLAGQSVSLAQGGGSSTITTVSGTTNAAGHATFTVEDRLAESVTYTATIGTTTVLQTASVTFTPGAATHLVVGAPASATAGGSFSVTVTAYDANGNVATGYAGTVHFTSSDGQAALPADHTFVPGTDSGAHTFGVTLKTAGTRGITATDTVTGTVNGSATVTVAAAAASAGVSTLAASPTSVLADGSTTSTLTSTLTDAYGNPVAGKTMTLTAGSGSSTIATVSGITNASGVATFTVKDGSVENVTFTATDTTDSVTVAQTASVSFTTGPVTAGQSTVAASPGAVTADGSTSSTVTVTLKDAQAHPVSGKTVSLAAGGGSSTITTVSGTTNASGVATFTVADAVAEAVTYTAADTSDAVTVTQAATITFTPGAVSSSQSTVSASPASVTADGSATSTITVTLEDANGNAVAGKAVSLAGSPTGSTVTTVSGTTDAAGHATFTVASAAAGPVVYTATDATDAVTVAQTATVTFDAGAVDATQSTVAAAPGSVTADGSTTSTVTVTATDAFGNPVAGQSVSLAQGGGSSTITTVAGITNAAGHATFAVKDTLAEAVTYTATIGATTVLQTASVSFTPGAVTHFTVSLPATSTAGDTVSASVTALDAHGNVVTGYSGTVHFTSSDPQAALPADHTFVPGSDHGAHTFDVALRTAGSQSVTAADGAANGSASVTVAPAGASASHSSVVSSPASVPADGTATSTVTVTIADAYDNPLGGKTVTLAGSPTTSSITTVSGTTSAAGRATFSVKSTTANTVTYTATDVSDATTVVQTATVGFATTMPDAGTSSVDASPTSVEADGSTAATITVTVRDANSNAIAGKTVALAKSGGSSSITTLSATTDASGRATFSVQDATVESTTYTASVPADGVTITQTASVAFVPGAVSPSHSSVASSPASVTADGATASTITVTVRDRSDHALSGVNVTLAPGSGSSSVAPAAATTNASGAATFSVADTTAETVAYTATAGGTALTQTAFVTFAPGAANAGQTTISIAPATLTAGGSTTVTARANDAFGNPLATGGATVVLAADHGTLSPVTDNGDGTYTATLSWTGAGIAQVTGTLNGGAIGHPASATFGPDPADAAKTSITVSPASITADGSSTATVTVHAKDGYGNALTSGGATVTLATDKGSLTAVTDDGDGTYTATLTSATTTGSAHLSGTLGGAAIGNPTTVAFVPGAADAAHTTITAAPGTLIADGSSTSTITVRVRDAFGNVLVAGGDTVTLSTDLGTLSSVADDGDGTYRATFTSATTVGTAHVTGTVNGSAIAAPTTVTLVPGAADAAHSTLGAAPAGVVADGSAAATITVRAKDAHGNTLTSGGATVVLATDRGTLSAVTDDGDGTYTATVTSTSAGVAHLSGTLNGTAIGATATVTFTAGAADGTHTTIAAAPATLTAGGTSTATITVRAYDLNGNSLVSGGDFVSLATDAGTLSLVTDNGNGTYTATFTSPTATGAAHITGTIDGATIGNPATVALVPGPADAAHTTISASPSSIGADGATTSTITVRAVDANGNAVTTGGATVTLATDNGSLSAVADIGDGTYVATLTSSTSTGTAHVTGTLGGTAIGHPATVQFVPSAGNPAHSTITTAPSSIVANGSSTATITVHAKDVNDNDLTSGGATVVLGTDKGTLSSVTDNGNGTYTATLTAPTTTGTAHVTGTLDGGAIGHPASVSLVPGPASAAHSVISIVPGSLTADGTSTSTVTVQAKDVNDNLVTSGGASVALATDAGSLSAVTDDGDGTYTATLTASTTTGTAHVTGTLDGSAIGHPATVTLVAGAPSGAHSAISASPTTLTADGASTSTLTVRLKDVHDNTLTIGGATVALATDAGSLSAVTDHGDGTYTATLTAPTSTGTAHVTGTVNGQAIATTASISLVPGTVSASHSTVLASSATSSTDAGNTVTVTVTVTDAHDNPIQGSHVVLTQGATSASIAPNPLVGADTDAAGRAVFTVADTVAETAVLSATADGTLVNQTASVQFRSGSPAQLVYGQQPGNTTAGATLAPSLTVRILDAHGNLSSSSAAVALAIKSGSGAAGATLAGTSVRNAVAGVATFDDLSIAKAGTGYVLSAATSGAGGADSASFDVATGPANAPHTTITASPASINADGSSGTAAITVHVRDAFDNPIASGGATVALATSRGSLSAVTDNGDGTYGATLTATGQSGTAGITGTLDGSAIGHPASVTLIPPVPVATIDGGVASSPTSQTSATFTFHSPNDDGNTTFECSLDGAVFAACTSPKTYSGLGDGSHTFRVHGVNANGPGANVSQSWTVDTVGPTATLTTAPSPYTNASSEPLAAGASDATTTVAAVDFRYAASAAACPTGTLIATDGTAPYSATWTLPADGSYVVCAVATDAVGNAGPAATSSVVVDQTKPGVTLSAFGTVVGPTTYVHGAPSLHTSATDATAGVASVDLSFAGATSGTVAHLTSSPYDTTWDTTALADGSYTVTSTATDRAGNSDTSSRSVTVDNTAPTASLDDPGAFGSGTIPLSVTATDTGSGVNVAGTVVQSSPQGANTWTTIAAPGSWTPADGSYDLRAIVEDNVGNQTTTATRTILVDNTPPTTGDDGDTSWHNSDVTLTLTATDAESGVATVEYKVDGGSWTTGTSVAVPTSLGDGSHTVTYHATNRAGVTSADRTATVKLDSTPPTVSDPSVTPSSSFARGTVDVASTVSDGAGSGIASTTYRLAAGGTGETTPPSACATWGSAVPAHFDTTTVADGTYALRTVAIDNALNGRCSSIATATMLKIDNTAPRTSDDAPFGAQNTDVTVHLTASDNFSGVASTEYRVDGGPWTAGTSVTVAAPANHADDGVHTIDYRSTDDAGNVESTKTTQVTIDTTAPSGSGVDPANLLSGTVVLEASPSESDIASVEWLYRPAGSSGVWTSIGTDNAAPWQMTWLTTGVADGSYDLEAVFTDTTGNSTTQAFSTKTIDNTAPDGATVTAPVAGTDLTGTIALAATAHDATSGIDSSKTTFQIQATGDSGWSNVAGNHFDTTAKPDGPAQVRVAVWDRAGNGPLYSAPVAFVVDNTAPTVAVGVPSTVSGTTPLTATGSADIATVSFDVSPHGAGTWTSIGTASSSPFGASWSTGSLADGLYDVRAKATDGGANTGTDVKTVRVDNTAPTAALTQPSGGSTVGGSRVTLAATASDAGAGVASVVFQYRAHGSAGSFTDLSTATASPYTATWDVTGLASGDYDVRVLVADAAGNTSASVVAVVTVDSTPPTLTGFAVPAVVSGSQGLHVTTSADTGTVTYGITPSGGGGWSQVGSSSSQPTFGAAFDTTAVADGVYDVRATAVDQFGNAATLTVPNVRVDNTSPRLVSSTPADGSVVASVNSVDATASEDLSAVTSLELDGARASFGGTVSGASVSFATGALAEGNHALTGELVDLAGNNYPFRINFTVVSGPMTTMPPTSKNVGGGVPTTLGTVDSTATVTVPSSVWQQPLPSSDDWLVLEVQPMATASLPTASLEAPSSVVDVHMFWNLAGTEEHHFDAPIEVDLTDPSGGLGVAATLESGAWRLIPALAAPGALSAGQQDGYWRAGGVVHILTRHLSVFAVLNGHAELQLAPPKDFSGTVAEDGLTLRWSPGIPTEQLQSFTLYDDGTGLRLPGTQFEAKLGPITSADSRRFTLTETNIGGAESAPSVALRVVPTVAGLTVADATAALAVRTFGLGKTIPTYAPGVPEGTVVGPTSVQVLPEGSTVDLQVAAASIVHTPFSFVAAAAPRVRATQRGLHGRVLVTSRARIDVTLDAYPWKRIHRWHFFHVRPGSTVLSLTPRHPLRPGTYRLFWKATSDVDHSVHRQVTWLTIVRPHVRVHPGHVPQVLVVGATRTTLSFDAGVRARVLTASPEQAYLYGTYHDVAVIVVDVDTQGLRLVHDLRAVFPSTAIVALSHDSSRRAAARRNGAVAVPASTPQARLTKLLLALAAR